MDTSDEDNAQNNVDERVAILERKMQQISTTVDTQVIVLAQHMESS